MPLDSRYMLAPSLQMYFVDKDSGLPLSAGKVFFYEDNTSILKPVFTIVASGTDFTYVQLPNPVTLSAVGTFQDASGNDILPYYFPFDGNDNIQLYRVEVYNSMNVLQFTRVGWPNISAEDVVTSDNVINFVPNGQFILHNNIPASNANGFIAGQVSQNVTTIAQGGWTFERAGSGSPIDNVSFVRYGSSISIPTGNPRYAVQIQTTSPGTMSRRDLCLIFPSVNTFASSVQEFNLYFEAQGVNGGDIPNVQVIVRKNFGTGGSPTTETNISTITLKNNSFTSFNIPILFNTNAGKTIGLLDDDYLQIAIRLPLGSTQTAQFTDFAIILNDTPLESFPFQTEAQQIAPSTAGSIPEINPNGFNLYLPAVLTPSGMQFDTSDIGEIVGHGGLSNYTSSLSTIGNKLLADGSQYRYNDYSPLGIPFARLGNYYIANGTSGVPQYGTGDNYVTSYLQAGSASQLTFTTNKTGSVTAPADGAAATGFTFTNLITGSAGFNYVAYTNGSTLITAICNTAGIGLASSSGGSSGMTVTDYRFSPLTYHAIQLTALSASALSVAGANPGKYFTFSNTTTTYYMWFKTALETDPAPGGTGIQVNLDLLMTAADVARVIANAMSGHQIYEIVLAAANTLSNGDYFQFTANSQLYVAYYIINAATVTPPAVANAIFIPVNILSTDTATLVTTKTQLALNQFYFKVPNLQGLFLRGYDPTGEWDIDYLSRFSNSGTLLGSSPGSQELDQISNHFHAASGTSQAGLGAGTDGFSEAASTGPSHLHPVTVTVNYSGGSESRPVNMAVVWAIKY